jgi:hypothetical protein
MASKVSTFPGGPLGVSGSRGGRLLGSLKDALAAASRDDIGHLNMIRFAGNASPVPASPIAVAVIDPPLVEIAAKPQVSAAEAARDARIPTPLERHLDAEPPTTRVVRASGASRIPDPPARTQLVRGKAPIKRGDFDQDPVVGWLVVVGGPGMGQYRPVFEGNNSVGRADTNRIALDFGRHFIRRAGLRSIRLR